MVAAGNSTPADRGRRRPVGRRAGLSLQGIVDAARSLGPDTDALTVQAVADKLGVDRKAVRHHVSDRDTLLRLMAHEAFAENAPDLGLPADAPWQEVVRRYAHAFADAVIATGALAEHLRLDSQLSADLGHPIEAVSQALTDAGIDDASALRALALLSNICMAYGQDVVYVTCGGDRPRRAMARRTLEGREHELSTFARLVDLDIDTYDRTQLDLSIEVFVHGIEAVLLRGKP
ncbi:hypothetical protein [Streptomyces sp. NPDC005799]|uniref:TetR/AcrR family transcriptional regulator n=1 Tax=Streptomyces sp. NPDC005799 TaxID=3154678 RepID=UPI00340CEFCF